MFNPCVQESLHHYIIHTCHRREAVLVLRDLQKAEVIACPRRDGSPLSANLTPHHEEVWGEWSSSYPWH
jgi:hypothetical protein